MSTHLHGAGGAPGIALGRAVRYLPAQPQATAPDADPATALARFADAQARAVASLNALAERLHSEGRPNEAAIFEAQALLADDPGLTDEVARRVRDEGTPLDAAVTATTAAMRAQLEALDDDYMRERAADMDAIGQSILAALHGHGSALRDLPPGAIIIAPDLTSCAAACGLASPLPMAAQPATPPFWRARWASRRWWAWARPHSICPTAPSWCSTAARRC
jgi:phosphotransferase system enzyme I (PtsI)